MPIQTRSRTKQTASAIIAALLVVALAAALLLLVQVHHQASIARTSDAINYERAAIFALGIEEWAIGRLVDYQKLPLEKRAKQIWPVILGERQDDGNIISGEIIDQQGKMNVNAFVNANEQKRLSTLLKTVSPATANPDQLASAIVQFVQQNNQQSSVDESSDDVDDEDTQSDNALRRIMFPSELRAISGMTPETLRDLMPYLTALPTGAQKININSAMLPVIMALDPGITAASAKAVIAEREQAGGFDTVETVNKMLNPTGTRATPVNIAVISNYFLVHAHIQRADIEFDLYSMLMVKSDDKEIKVSVLWRSQIFP